MPSTMGVPTYGCWRGTKGTPSLLSTTLLPPASPLRHKHLQLSSGPAPNRFSLPNPGKTNSAKTRAVLQGNRAAACHTGSPQVHSITLCADGMDRVAGDAVPSDGPEIALFTKKTLKSAPGSLFLLTGTVRCNSPHRGEPPCSPLSTN